MAKRTNGEGTIHYDKERKGWVGQLTVDGRRRKVRARTKVDCAAKLSGLRREAESGLTGADGNVTVGQLLELWRSRVLANREIDPSTRDNYERDVRRLTAELGTVRLAKLDVERVELAIDTIASGGGEGGRGRPLSRRTLKMVRSTLVQALDLAVKRRMIPYNPAGYAELTPTATRASDRRSLTAVEAAKLWKALDGERLENLFKVMLTIGLRPAEATGICWDAVDFKRGTLAVRRVVRRDGGRVQLVDDAKNDGAFRTISLPEPTLEALRRQKVKAAEIRLAATVWSVNDPGLAFPTVEGRPWDPSNVREELTAICAKADVTRIVPYELRHSAASILNDQGVPLEEIADLLGHKDVTMLARVYRHRLRPTADAAVGTMNAMFS